MEEKIREELYQKLSLEYDSFIEEIKKLPPEKIIDKSYEKVMKEEAMSFFYPETKIFDLDEIKALKKEKNSLETLYQGWMDCDLNISELVEDNIRETVSDLARDFKEKQAKKKDKER